MRTSWRPDLRGQAGITIVEAMIASAVLLVALLGGFLAIESASSATKTAERQAIAAAAGEEELERLAGLDFAALVHCSAPTQSADPGAPAGQVPENPAYFVNASRFRVLADYRKPGTDPLENTNASGEVLAVASGSCPAGGLTTPQASFNSGGVTGTVWRYITIREDSCPPNLNVLGGPLEGLFSGLSGLLNLVAGLLGGITDSIGLGVNLFCSQPQDSKRVTVAVVVDDASTLGPRKPTWMSTIATNEDAGLILDEESRLDF